LDLLDCIADQMAATNKPLVAVTVAAVPCPDTPVILTLHWHGFIEERILDVEEAEPVQFSSIPSSALQVNRRWNDLALLDRAAMEAGWELGAWDVARTQRPGCGRPGAPAREALECLQAFGALPQSLGGQQMIVSDTPDAEDLVDVAARRGYLMWIFRPVHGGIWAEVADDATLHPDGRRSPPCPLLPIPPAAKGPSKTVYRFGISGSPLNS
jgi:hypothetical protein